MRFVLLLAAACALHAQEFDLVIANGHVMDPESGLDAVRNIGITAGKIRAISAKQLLGRDTIPARDLIVAPGYIEMNAQGGYDELARTGVTTALDTEMGAFPVAAWYQARTAKSAINFGATAGHLPARTAAMHGEVERAPTGSEMKQTFDAVREGLQAGAIGIGISIGPRTSIARQEVFTVFALAAERKAPIFLRLRDPGAFDGLQEAIADAAATQATVRIVNLEASAGRQTPLALEMIDGAHRHGVDIEASHVESNLPLMEELRSKTLSPAERAHLAGKGRIKEGADADLVIFEPGKPTAPVHVIVSGVPVVRDAEFKPSVHPGKAVRR